MSPIRHAQRFWFRLLPLLLMVSLIITSLAGTAVAESGNPMSPGSTTTVELSICGSKYNDVNGNGVQDPGEPGLAGWTIELLDAAGTVVATTVSGPTDAAGRTGTFCFNNVRAGSYTVREVDQTGWVQTQPTAPGTYSVTVGAGSGPGSLFFGNRQSPTSSRICGIKFEDKNGNGVQDKGEPGLGGWTIQITDEKGNVVATAVTREDGSFCFESLRPGDYTVSEVMQSGWQQTLPGGTGAYTVQLSAAQSETKPLLFGNMKSPAQSLICGIKFEDKNGNGKQDPGELGLGGWTIEVKDAASNWAATAVTDKDGKYCVKGLPPGLYTFAEVMQDGYQQTFPGSPFTHTVRVVVGQNAQSVDFGNQKEPDPCCLSFDFLGGRADNFSMANGAEPAQPSAALVQAMPASAVYSGFDGTVDNMFVAHTFTLPAGNCVESATLEFKAKPMHSNSDNDTLSLRFAGASGSPVWGTYLGAFQPSPGLVTSNWTPPMYSAANYSAGQVFSLDLASLPGGVNLIPTLNAERFLDFVVQDDTIVDYARLTVTFCECATSDPFDPKPVDDHVNRPRPSSVTPGFDIRLMVDSRAARVNGEDIFLPGAPVLLGGSTFVPLRSIGDMMGAEVQWDPTERRVTFVLGDRTVVLWIDKVTALVNGKEVSLSSAPTLIDGSTFVPLRFTSENLGAKLEYNPADRSMRIFDRWGNL